MTNEQNDKKQFTPMIKQVKEIKEELKIKEKTDGIADSGYFSEKTIIDNIDQDDLQVIITPNAENKKKVSTENYQQEDFNYDKEKDVYICPAGKELKKVGKNALPDKNGRETFVYKCNSQICEGCLKKNSCTKGKNGRKLLISANKEKMQTYIENLETKKTKN